MKAGEETGSIGSYEFVPLGTGGTVGKSLTGLKLIILMERIKDSHRRPAEPARELKPTATFEAPLTRRLAEQVQLLLIFWRELA
jgi:hypothetical protein